MMPSRTRAYRWLTAGFIVLVNVLPLLGIASGTRAADWLAFAVIQPIIAFSIIGGLHRYFAHRSFETSRAFQLLMGVGATLVFTDPIGFAGKHRLHHRFSDAEGDVHRPEDGFWYCWFGSLMDEGYREPMVVAQARDLAAFPELRWLHRWFFVPGVLLAIALLALGGVPMLAVGYALPVAFALHMTSAVNYFCHLYGTRRYETADRSRNNPLVAVLTLGEGWHNNHHHFPGAARAGFYWWELDPMYWVIRLLAALGIVWGVREVPARVLRSMSQRSAP